MPSDLPSVAGVKVLRLDRRTFEEHVYAGVSVLDDVPVRVRLYRSLYPSAGQLAARRHAIEMGQLLADLPGVLAQREVVPVGYDLALVTDAPALDELDRWWQASPTTTTRDRLRVAASVANALAQVHGRGVTHNALHPALIGVEASLATRIGGLDRAMSLRSEASGAAQLAESLVYVSPEQTGRMNRPVDNRSDLYSLGVIIFQLFAGRPPFTETDALALVHAHVARPAPRLVDVAPDVPAALAEVVAVLLEKDPDHRYQTAAGVAHDLALIELADGDGRPITLRSADVSEQLVMREHLYGREDEVRHLADALVATTAGTRRAVWVAGYSGIGKSSLVHELEPMVVERFGWFAEGKFDLYQRDVPYVGWVGALQAAVGQLLVLPDDELAAMRVAIISSLGSGAAALANLCPELTRVIGDQPVPDEATPHEAQARLAQAVSTFVATLATAGRPLVLFLDDLQWADLASLRLLEAVLSDRSDAALLVVGAWRENEITSDHPVRWLLQRLEDGGSSAQTLQLAPLELVHVQAIVADALRGQSSSTTALGALIHEKTGGNPFFVRQFLLAMQRDGALAFDRTSTSWSWDLDAVKARAITDNVAELLAGRYSALSSTTLGSLQAASVVGTAFHLSDVARLTGHDFLTTAQALDDALNEQLITPLDEQYRYVLQTQRAEGTSSEVDPEYSFLHDRVRQAALDTLDPPRRQSLHLAQARALREADGADDTVIEVASHLCEAVGLLDDAEERVSAAGTMVSAARRAKSTMAVATAARYLEVGIAMMPAEAWTMDYALMLALHTEAADVAYIDGRYDDVATITALVLSHVTDALDRVPIHNILIGVGVARADYQRATQYALDVLASDFGIDVSRHPSMARVATELAQCRAAIGRRSTGDLLALAPMTDPTFIAVMGILMKTATNAYWAEPNLVPIIAARMIRISVVHGNDSLSAYGYALYAMVTGGVLGAERTGYQFGQLSMDLLELRPNRSLTGRTALLWHGFVRHSRDPMRECVTDLFDTYHAALEAGDVENACYCATVGFYGAVLSGSGLATLTERYRGYVETVMLGGQAQTRGALAAWLQAVELLRSPSTRSALLVGEHVDWVARRAELVSGGDGTAMPTEGSAAGFFAFLMDDMSEAEHNLGLVWEHRDGGPGQLYLGPCFALYAVSMLRRRAKGDRRPADRARLARLRHLVKTRARHNPHDMEPFRLFLEAETEHSEGRRAQAIAAYLDTATEAHRRGVTYLEALALDEAGAMEAEAGHGEQAAHLVATASDVWRGLDVPFRTTARVERDSATPEARAQDDSPLGALDLRTLLDMMQTISREIEVDGLIQRVLSLVIRNAGATRGVLLLVSDGAVRAVAEGEPDVDGSVTVRTGADMERATYLQPVVDYVVRTSEALLIEDAASHELIRQERRVAPDAKGSILCVPLVQAGSLVGAVYLANPQAARVFTNRQMVVVETICGQAAVTLNNARLYEEQRSQAESFSRFVPRPFLEQLGRQQIGDVGLGDAVKVDVTVAFSDVRGFTELSEGSSAVESFELLNRYLGRMEPAIRRNGGFIDKYFGDGVMSLFIDGSDGAVAAAIDMNRALGLFNTERTSSLPMRMGIGIHAGEVMLGTVGSVDRLDTTVIGDTVNTASRLEGATKEFCGAVLVSRQVVERLTDPGRYLLREVGRITVLGKTEVVEVHEVLAARPAPDAEAAAEARATFAEALSHWYAADFASAARLFRLCLAAAPSDQLANQYAQRCDHYLVETPVGEWRGVEAMHSK